MNRLNKTESGLLLCDSLAAKCSTFQKLFITASGVIFTAGCVVFSLQLVLSACFAALKFSPYFILVQKYMFWFFWTNELIDGCFKYTLLLKDIFRGR